MSLGMTREQAEAFLHRLADAAEEASRELGIDPEDVALGVQLRVRPDPSEVEVTITRTVPPPPGSTLN